MDADTTPTAAPLPEGEYAIVELLGHTTLIGRIDEVDRFGTKMLQIEPIFAGQLLGPVFQGGGSIYRLTPCSAEVAASKGATSEWQLPAPVRATIPVAMLPPPVADDDEEPF